MKEQITEVIADLLKRNEDGSLAEVSEITQLSAAKLLQNLMVVIEPMHDALGESNSLLVAMLHEARPNSEINEQIIQNRGALVPLHNFIM